MDSRDESIREPTVLAIAGFDPSSGAGITADLLTFAAHGLFSTAAITAHTVQSTRGVRAVQPVDPQWLRDTLACLEEDLPPTAIKIGMLATEALVVEVAHYLRQIRGKRHLQVVLDPVLRSSSGTVLLDQAGLQALQTQLLPLVNAITPNLEEAALLAKYPCENREQMQHCAELLRAQHPHLTLVITGGHLLTPADLLLEPLQAPAWLSGEHIVTTSTHGTGCAFSTALLANRTLGHPWPAATAAAKAFVANAMREATPHGSGHGPLALFHATALPSPPVTPC